MNFPHAALTRVSGEEGENEWRVAAAQTLRAGHNEFQRQR